MLQIRKSCFFFWFPVKSVDVEPSPRLASSTAPVGTRERLRRGRIFVFDSKGYTFSPQLGDVGWDSGRTGIGPLISWRVLGWANTWHGHSDVRYWRSRGSVSFDFDTHTHTHHAELHSLVLVFAWCTLTSWMTKRFRCFFPSSESVRLQWYVE